MKIVASDLHNGQETVNTTKTKAEVSNIGITETIAAELQTGRICKDITKDNKIQVPTANFTQER